MKISIVVILLLLVLVLRLDPSESIGIPRNNHFYNRNNVLLRAPSLFRSDEIEYHKYAAILATTEPYRQICTSQLKDNLHPVHYYLSKLLGRDLMNLALSLRYEIPEINDALNRYSDKLQSALNSYGMIPSTFNEMSSKLDNTPVIKKRILLQAYFYKIVADLEANLLPSLPQVPAVMEEKSIKSKSNSLNIFNHIFPYQKRKINNDERKRNRQIQLLIDKEKEERFLLALQEIEDIRINIRDKIKRELHLNTLPERIADPELLPAMCPLIQRASNEFPSLAMKIIQKHNLHTEEFNQLQDRVEKDFLFRWKINNKLKTHLNARKLATTITSSAPVVNNRGINVPNNGGNIIAPRTREVNKGKDGQQCTSEECTRESTNANDESGYDDDNENSSSGVDDSS